MIARFRNILSNGYYQNSCGRIYIMPYDTEEQVSQADKILKWLNRGQEYFKIEVVED